MKTLLLLVLTIGLVGCARFKVEQRDESPEARTITTKISGTAWFSSVQNISKIKATQTDKTQSFGTDSVGQQGSTNAVAALEAVVKILQAINPQP